MNQKIDMTAQQAFDKTVELLKGYADGDLHGGNPMQYIEKFANQFAEDKDKEIAELNKDLEYQAQAAHKNADEILSLKAQLSYTNRLLNIFINLKD